MAIRVLPGAGLAHEGDQFHAIIQQGIQREMLLAVARFDAPDAFPAIMNGNQFGAGGVHFGQRRLLRDWRRPSACRIRWENTFCRFQRQFVLGAEGGHLARAETVRSTMPVYRSVMNTRSVS